MDANIWNGVCFRSWCQYHLGLCEFVCICVIVGISLFHILTSKPICVAVKIFLCCERGSQREEGVWGGRLWSRSSRMRHICGLCMFFFKGVYQRIFTGCCLVQYQGRAALPHPPIIIIRTHISSQPLFEVLRASAVWPSRPKH